MSHRNIGWKMIQRIREERAIPLITMKTDFEEAKQTGSNIP